MNILITAPSLDTSRNVSGISSVVMNIVKYSNYKFVHFLVGKEDNEKSDLRWLLKQFGLIFKFPIAARHCKIIHLNTALNPLSVVRDYSFLVLAKILRKKVLLHLHGGKYLMTECNNFLLNAVITSLLKRSDYIIVLSQLEKEKITSTYPVNKITFLVNSIAVNELSFSRSDLIKNEMPAIIFLEGSMNRKAWKISFRLYQY